MRQRRQREEEDRQTETAGENKRENETEETEREKTLLASCSPWLGSRNCFYRLFLKVKRFKDNNSRGEVRGDMRYILPLFYTHKSSGFWHCEIASEVAHIFKWHIKI
jgi:hypothetical protein